MPFSRSAGARCNNPPWLAVEFGGAKDDCAMQADIRHAFYDARRHAERECAASQTRRADV